MFGSSFRIATVWGIPIRIHISLVVVWALFALMMGLSGGPAGVVRLLALEAGIFASIALHELGHSFVALRQGCRVREITLLFIGGAAQMERIPTRPAAELAMAAAGPLVSVVLGTVLWALGGLLDPVLAAVAWPSPLRYVRAPIVCNVVVYVGLLNFGLAAFNLLPAFPMDGGRILRALLSRRLGRLRATFVAARIGKLLALALGLAGLFGRPRSWMLVAIAFFVHSAAEREFRMVEWAERERAAGGAWDGEFAEAPAPGGGDEVVVGPPPYAGGRGSTTEVRPLDRGPRG